MNEAVVRGGGDLARRALSLQLSAILWLGYAAVTFGLSCLAVAGGHGDRVWSAWLYIGGIATAPVATLLGYAGYRWQQGQVLSSNGYGWLMAVVQVLGVVAVVAAALYPPVVLHSFLNPGVTIRVDNQSQYRALVRTEGPGLCSHSDEDYITPRTARDVTLLRSHIVCWGSKVQTIKVLNVNGSWSCNWSDDIDEVPLVITDDGPTCPVTTYEPGTLTMPPTEGGSPFSPSPGAKPAPVATP